MSMSAQKLKCAACALLLLCATCSAALAVDRYVSPSGTDVSPYTNWATAALSIQDAIDASSSGDVILVETGTYYESISFMGKDITLASRFLTTSNESYISETVIDAGASDHVVSLVNGETTNALLSGFTITNGYSSGGEPAGGGVYCYTSSPRLENLLVTGNHADGEGGGMYLVHSSPQIRDVALVGNDATSHGGGIRVSYGTPTIINLEVVENTSSADGGGICLYHTDCPMQNVLIADNAAAAKGGGMFFDASDPELENMTIVGNSGSPGGGLNVSYSSHPKLVNSIVWGNTPTQIVYDTYWYGMQLTIEYSDVQGGADGVQTFGKGPVNWLAGNLTVDPVLEGDYGLSSNSLCVNAGTNRSWMSLGTDLAKAPRIVSSVVDMGAYEYQGDAGGVTIQNPDAVIGPTVGAVSALLEYSSGGASCSDGSQVQYRFDWDDGGVSDWAADTNASHAWSQVGVYSVRAQARSVSNAAVISGWSTPLSVTVTQEVMPAATHYVSPTGNNTSPYTNWTTAAHSIQDAIDVASDGATVLVGPATYVENITFSGKSISVGSLQMTTGDDGYIGQTIIDGGASGCVVTFDDGETTNALLSGFTITNGWATGGTPVGGGIFCSYSSPRLENLLVTGNRADGEGGGIYMVYCDSPVRDVAVIGNSASSHGGGIRVSYGTPSFLNLEVVGNNTSADAGGICLYHTDCPMQNVLIAENNAAIKGGGMFFDASSPELENMTIAGNSGSPGGGLNVSYSSHPKLINSIVWGNSPTQIVYDVNWSGMQLTIEYSDVQGGADGVQTFGKGPVNWLAGNLTVDPEFIGAGDYGLGTASVCINAGTNRGWMASGTDLAKAPRIVNSVVDMGAYESQGDAGGVTIDDPDTPIGPSLGAVDDLLEYASGGASCSDGSPVQYRFDWDDGDVSDWVSFTNAYHAWAQVGTYSIKAQARSVSNAAVISGWSPAISVTITQEVVPASIHYVSPTGNDTSPYTNWTTAAHSIQDAIDVASDGATVLVGPATYVENITFSGKNISVGSLQMTTGDDDYIGQTIIDGGASGCVVTFDDGETTNALLSGFTITNGWATGGTPVGGGIFCSYSSPRLENLLVTGNRSDGEGGGIYMAFSYAQIRDVALVGNNASSHGGGMRISYGTPSLFNVEVVENSTSADGGGICLYHTHCPMQNVLIAENSAAIKGGGMFFDASSPELENMTIAGNSGSPGGGLNISYNSHPKLVNSIVWGNSPTQIVYDTQWGGMQLTVEYSDVQGGSAGVQTFGKGPVNWLAGNITVDPLLAGDFSLQGASPCIDEGTNRTWMLTEVDLLKSLRIQNDTVDMGAIEYNPSPGVGLGSVSCTLYPEQANSVGAAWKLTTGQSTNWNSSGDILRNIPVGDYTVVFKPIDTWVTPASQPVSVTTGVISHVYAVYAPLQGDSVAPVFVSVYPPDGYVGLENHVFMTIVVTDNVGIASVIVDRKEATAAGGDTFEFTTTGVRGSHNPQVIVATDMAGNETTQTVVYGMSNKIKLRAIWDGYWRIANPFASNIVYTWTVDGSAENGGGIALSNRYHYFSTSLGDKVLRLWVDGMQADVKNSSKLPPPPPTSVDESEIDSDLDGYSNLEEEVAGTDVNDGASVFSLDIGDSEERSPHILSWHGGIDSLYTLYISTNLNDWVVVPDCIDVPGSGETISYTNDTDAEVFFLRISAEKRP